MSFSSVKKLASKYLEKKISNLKVNMSPNITVMVSYANYNKLPISSFKFNDEIIAWAAHENTKSRFKTNQSLWTIQCTEKFSKKTINLFKKNKKKYEQLILKKFEVLAGYQAKNVIFQNIHGWKFAYKKAETKSLESLWLNKYQLGVCGDWMLGNKAEHAWISAKNLSSQIKKNPSR